MTFYGSMQLKLPMVVTTSTYGDRSNTLFGSWGFDGHKFYECYVLGCTKLAFNEKSHYDMKLIDPHGDTIHLMSTHMPYGMGQ
jgi:hypothetical protein